VELVPPMETIYHVDEDSKLRMAYPVLLEQRMATSAQILGSSTRSKVPSRWSRQYQQLCVERDKLLDRDCSATENFQPKLDDLAEAASEESQRSLTLVAATVTYDTIKEVLAAIRRIEQGTYGICEITGKPIPAERLSSIPWARCSLEGQQQLEQEGLGRRNALPVLEGLGRTDDVEPGEEDDSE
jgi:DnaK suppressor protein